MKLLVLALCISIQILSTFSKVLPNNYPKFCSKSEPEYNQCMESAFQKMGPYLLKGIKGVDFPKFHPLVIPSFLINRNLNSFIKIKAEMRNIQVYGFDSLELNKFDFDPETLKGQIIVYIPTLNFKLEYDATGIIGDVNLQNAGFVSGNVSGVDYDFNFKLKKTDRVGVEYLTLTNIDCKGGVQNANIRLIAKKPEQQPTADFITELFNESVKELFEIVNPIYEESMETFFGDLFEKFLAAIPADELLPE